MKCKRNKKFYTQNVCHKNGVLVPFKGAIMYHLHGDEKIALGSCAQFRGPNCKKAWC